MRGAHHARYLPDPSGFLSAGVDQVSADINENLTDPFGETDLAPSPA